MRTKKCRKAIDTFRTGQAVVTTVYDIAGRVTTVSTPVVAGDPSSGTFTNFYDLAGRFYKEQYPDGLSVVHVLDANSNVTKTTYPDGYFVDRVYDELNRLTDIKLNGAGTSAVQFQYDALSRRTKLVYENGCTTNYAFEVDNDLSSLLHNFVGSNVQFNYSFDNANQMATHRVSDPANFRWTPPAPATTTYGTANNVNQYPTVGGTGQTYSTDGNLTNDGTFKYELNSERMMTRVRNAGTNAIIADYIYDPAQRQRQKNVGGVKTNYYYAGFQRLADYDGSAGTPGTLLNRYVYGAGMDEILIQITDGGTKTYYHSNHQGSVIATTNSSGVVLNRYTYGPFGESAALTGTTHGYTGQRYDSETGNYYFKMRQYSSKLGRFLQADPIGMAGGMNLYAYVGNSPLRASDSMGLAADGGGNNGSGSDGGSSSGGAINYLWDPFAWSEWSFSVYFHDVQGIGLHASIIGQRSRTRKIGSGGSHATKNFYNEFAEDMEYLDFSSGPTNTLPNYNRQRSGAQAIDDALKQFAALRTPESENNFFLGTGDGLKTALIDAANKFNPGGTGIFYVPIPQLFGTNSNNYVRYLLDSVGYTNRISTVHGSAPGINESIVMNGKSSMVAALPHYGQWTELEVTTYKVYSLYPVG